MKGSQCSNFSTASVELSLSHSGRRDDSTVSLFILREVFVRFPAQTGILSAILSAILSLYALWVYRILTCHATLLSNVVLMYIKSTNLEQ